MKKLSLLAALVVAAGSNFVAAADTAPLFTAAPTILLRSPDPVKLAEFYKALGFVEARSNEVSVLFYLDGHSGALEIMKMDPNTKPSGPKTSRTQQSVVVYIETSDQDGVLARAKAAGAKLIETWTAGDKSVSIHYIADPENNIFGFAPRHYNANIKTP